MRDKLHKDIDQLRAEIANIDYPEGFEDHIQALNAAFDLLHVDVDLEQSDEINEQLNQVVTYFEIDLPVIHGLLRNLMKSLGDIGI